jgi:hypothetical protein
VHAFILECVGWKAGPVFVQIPVAAAQAMLYDPDRILLIINHHDRLI